MVKITLCMWLMCSSLLANEKLCIQSLEPLIINERIQATEVILQAPQIVIGDKAVIETFGGDIQIGSEVTRSVYISPKAKIISDAKSDGDGGSICLVSREKNIFYGQISAKGKGLSGKGGAIKVCCQNQLIFDGSLDVSAECGCSGSVFLDPESITIQSTNPDINGNGSNLDITFTTQLDNALTTPAGFPDAASIVTSGALSNLLTTGANITLAAQNTITVNAAITAVGNNTTLTLSAPIVNLNQVITLPGSGVLQGSGVNTANVGPNGNPQNGIDVVTSGGTVNLATATYVAPFNIFNDLTLNGNGQSNTIISITGAVPSYVSRNPAVYVTNQANATIQNLTINGNNIGFPTNPSIVGILFSDAGGAVLNTHITQIANNAPPYLGGQQGNSIRAVASLPGPYNISVQNNLFDFFQKAGVVINGSQFIVDIQNNTINGQSLSTPGAIGIQLNGGSGTISGNTLNDISFPDHATAAAILIISNDGVVNVSDNSVNNSDNGILGSTITAPLNITGNNVENSGDVGIGVYDTTAPVTIQSNTLINNGGLAPSSEPNASIYLFSSTTQNFTVQGNTIQPAPSTPGVFTQGNGSGLGPVANLSGNNYVDP